MASLTQLLVCRLDGDGAVVAHPMPGSVAKDHRPNHGVEALYKLRTALPSDEALPMHRCIREAPERIVSISDEVTRRNNVVLLADHAPQSGHSLLPLMMMADLPKAGPIGSLGLL